MKSQLNQDFIHVVIGIILNTKNEVLVTKRKRNAHLGGLLEFPGGKLKADELPKIALRRELQEELNIDVRNYAPLIQIPYSYPDRRVLLDVFTVTDYFGTPSANESQELVWMRISKLNSADFPSANLGIIGALRLPKLIPVTPQLSQDPDDFLRHFEEVAKKEKASMIHLRSHELNDTQYMQLAQKCLALCEQHSTKLILNREAECLNQLKTAGLHLTSRRLLAAIERPLGKEYLVSASCHDSEEIHHASKLGLDYIFLGPVVEKILATKVDPIGWNKFRELAKESLIPVYAIGGLTASDVHTAMQHGGQGVAAIRDFWISNTEN